MLDNEFQASPARPFNKISKKMNFWQFVYLSHMEYIRIESGPPRREAGD